MLDDWPMRPISGSKWVSNFPVLSSLPLLKNCWVSVWLSALGLSFELTFLTFRSFDVNKNVKKQKEKLKKKAKKVAEIRSIQMAQLAEVEMQEQLRLAGDYDDLDDECIHRNGSERFICSRRRDL